MGPSPIKSTSGYKFYISFVDDCTRFTWVYPLKTKDEALSTFIHFKHMVENQTERKIKALQSDWGGEFRSFKSVLDDHGILFRHSCPYTSVQNGRVERKHRHIVEMGLTLLAQAKMPLYYWWEAFTTAVYLINRLPTPILMNISRFEKLFRNKPDYNGFKTFGCACFPCLRPYNQSKFQFHSTKCVFLGYNGSHKGYKCLSSTGKIYISRHVIFNEEDFPFSRGFLNHKQPQQAELVTTTDHRHSTFLHDDDVVTSVQDTNEDSILPTSHGLEDPFNPTPHTSHLP